MALQLFAKEETQRFLCSLMFDGSQISLCTCKLTKSNFFSAKRGFYYSNSNTHETAGPSTDPSRGQTLEMVQGFFIIHSRY